MPISASRLVGAAAAARAAYLSPSDARASAAAWGHDGFAWFDRGSTQAFASWDKRCGVVSFRGTEPWSARRVVSGSRADIKRFRDTIVNVNAGSVQTSRGWVHAGFNAAVDAIWPELVDRLPSRMFYPGAVTWCGHSLGGALATLAAARCSADITRAVITFGSPHVGGATFAAKYPLQERTWRVVNNNDIVPRLQWWRSHVGQIVYIDSSGTVHQDAYAGWRLTWDRIKGRLSHFGLLGTDGIADHDLRAYIECLSRAVALEAEHDGDKGDGGGVLDGDSGRWFGCGGRA